ncbi:unnamed protein product [Coregonus sp. 'balchen']|nr:unnamed protein product [Coregonus sp. 'balchen']
MDLVYPTFSLEMDRKNDESAQSRQVKKPDRMVCPGHGQTKAPMDSDYQEELEKATPKIRFNLNFDKTSTIGWRDSLGNMVLHALVVVSTDNAPENTDFITSMYDYILTTAACLHPRWRLEDLENNCA